MSKLTDPKIKAAKPGAKKIKMADGNGLTLIVHPKGSKTWVLRYRVHGKAKEMTLGTYPATTLKEARERALEQRSILQDGKDPVREEAREKVREQLVANDLFETIAKAFISKRTKWSDGHRDRFVHRMEKDVYPVMGAMRAKDIQPLDIMQVANAIMDRKSAEDDRARIDTAKRVVGMIGQVLAFAAVNELTPHLIDTKKMVSVMEDTPAPKHRDAILDPHRMGEFLRDLYAWPHDSMAVPLLKMLSMTAQRPIEVRHMRWSDLDMDKRVWFNPVSKIGAVLAVPITDQMAMLLQEMRIINGNRDYVFASEGNKPMSNVLPSKMIHTLGYKGIMSAHGFRACIRTMGVEDLKFSSEWVEAQLSHRSKEAHGRSYDRTKLLDERRQMMATWCGWLDRLRMQDENVVALKSGSV